MKKKVKKIFAQLLVIVFLFNSFSIPTGATEVIKADHIIISQVYGGGGNSGATYKNDFIELYNPTDVTVDLTGWSVQYASASGAFGAITVLNGVIEPGQYYLIQQAAGAGGTIDLPTPNVVGSIGMSGTSGKVVLAKKATSVTIPTVLEPGTDPDLVDLVGFGTTANYYEGSGRTPAPSNTTAAIRAIEGVDTDNNAADFIVAPPNPRSGVIAPVVTKCATPLASTPSGAVKADTIVTFTTTTPEATIEYNTVSATETVWVSGASIKIEANSTYFVRATKVGLDNSDIATYTYTIQADVPVVESRNIKEVLDLPVDTKDVVVTGQLAYFATSYSNPVIQSVIDNKTYSLYVFGAAPSGAKIGDVVSFKGTYTIYGGLPELTSVLESKIIATEPKMQAETVTIADLKTNGLNMLARFVKIQNVTLGVLNSAGSTSITDGTGTINIYKATAYPTMVEAGDVVDVYAIVNCFGTTVQLSTGTPEANGFNVYDVVTDTKKPLLTLADTYLKAQVDQDYLISVGAADNKGIGSVTMTYTIGSVTKSNQVMVYNTLTSKYEFTIPGNQVVETASSLDFTITAKDVTGLETQSAMTRVPIDNKPQVSMVVPARNSSTGSQKSPVITATLENAGNTPVVTLTLKKENAIVVDEQAMTVVTTSPQVYTYNTSNLTDGAYSAQVTVLREDGKSIVETWNFTVGTPKFQAYFGQLHSHTAEYSDGSGTLANGLNYIANIAQSDNVDFVAFTDHSNYFDTTAAANPAEALNDTSKMTAASLTKWNSYVSSMASFNESNAGSKVALAGFEMTWSGGPGHINTFNSTGVISRNNTTLNNKTTDAGMKAYYETLIKNTDPLANLSQFNHPGATFGTFSDFAYWSPSYDNKMVAVEVGNGEGAIGSGGYFASYSEYTKALDKGWHVSPTNNQDNHKGSWGNANTARTVIISDDLSSNGLITGLKNMSVYASEDKNLTINYTVNDLMMGTIISDVPTESLKFNIQISDSDRNDTISKVELVTNGGRVATSKAFESNEVEWSFDLPSIQGYYYIRVTQADKNMAVTAPIWVGQAPLVGITSFEASTKMPVTDEALTLTTTLFNNEASPVTVNSIVYTQGDKVISTVSEPNSIATTGTFKHALAFTPTIVGETMISVIAECTVAGQSKTFTQNITLNVRDSNKLIYIGIDASHNNEYVAGNYKASMGNFADMAVSYGVRVVELNTSEALMAATTNPKFAMLVLTPPTRRNGSNFLIGYKNYTEVELEAIKSFAELGKTVIVAGWSDTYENYTKYSDNTAYALPAADHMSAQQNNLLLKIGSTLRISDDEINDSVTNGGSAQRLYLKNYNLDNSFLANVKPLEQVYSNYGGATIYGVDSDKKPSSTLSPTVSPMVYGFTTSTSVDKDKDGTTNTSGVLVPKYSDKHLVAASEKVTYANGNTGTIIVAGAVFMSNFEIQVAMDSYATPAYSNYTILENIVQSINPVTITNIADVQAAPIGQSFTIRGIATSNASGFDKDSAFFDCIYVQDATAGINAFPVSGDIRAGQMIEITGKTSAYNGERQIAVEQVKVIDESISALPTPITMTTAEVASANNLGSLVKVTGEVVSIELANNIVESIIVKDSSNVSSRVFIDGYITQTKTIANLEVGGQITAIGLMSIDTLGSRIRVRDRADIECTAKPIVNGGGSTPTPTPTTGSTTTSPSTTTTTTTTTTTITDDLTPQALPVSKFKDVKVNDWFFGAVSFLVEKELTKGTGIDTFSPTDYLTRGQFMVILMRSYGLEADGTTGDNFADAGNTYYTNYLAAAKNLGITNGIGNNLFAPEQKISRQDMFTMVVSLLRIVKQLPEIKGNTTLNNFTDSGSIISYAINPTKILVEGDKVKGFNKMLRPQEMATRAEMAQLISNLLETK